MGAHSCLGASSASRWMACPASVRLCQNIPSTSSSYADEGTTAHELAERCLIAGDNTADHKGESIVVSGKAYKVDEDMVDYVQQYLDAVREAAGDEPIGAETRFDLNWLFKGVSLPKGVRQFPNMFGTNDAKTVHPFEVLYIFDLKYGAGVPVEVENNAQLMYYALGELGPDNPDMVEEVEMCIVQPRYDHPDGVVRRWRISVDDLYKWAYEELLPAALATLDPNAPAVPGDKQCRWCKAAPCSAMNQQCLDACCAEFGEPPTVNAPTPDVMSDEELSQAMQMAPTIEKWLKSVAAELFNRMDNGADIPEYKLVYKRTNRAWKDPVAAAKSLRQVVGDKAVKITPVGIGAATTLLKRAKLDVTLIDRLTFKPEPGLTLAHVSDKRPAQASSAESAFGDPLLD